MADDVVSLRMCSFSRVRPFDCTFSFGHNKRMLGIRDPGGFPSPTFMSCLATQRLHSYRPRSWQRAGRRRLTVRDHAIPENTKTVCFPCTLLRVSLFDCNRAISRARVYITKSFFSFVSAFCPFFEKVDVWYDI